EFAGADISLIDMGSTEGTAVNGAKVTKVKLNSGDQIAIGDATLVVSTGAAGQPRPMPAAPDMGATQVMAMPPDMGATQVMGMPAAGPPPGFAPTAQAARPPVPGWAPQPVVPQAPAAAPMFGGVTPGF